MAEKKKIGVIGSGTVGQVLANGFTRHGFDVMIGTRAPEKMVEWKQKSGGKAGNFEETAKFGDVIVMATKGLMAENAIRLCGQENLSGKTVIDVTNPIDDQKPPTNGVLHYFTSLEESLMERLQRTAPRANFVKAFNSVGNAFMVNPEFGDTPTMFICGNSEDAKKEVSEILSLFGWEAMDMGKAESARAIEPLCILWCIPGLTKNQWSHAFKLLKK
ncbi:MAG: NAD(P)-binding domain-containing protein [Candidatus Diapherotrites archaeon]|nr:NAD(P)-binding domain-containing protein [Candidatus Diapherotrites archaeon]